MGSAGVHQLCQPRLAYAPSLHFLAKLLRNDARDGFGLCRFPDALFVEKLVERRAPVRILLRLAHFVSSQFDFTP